jgi:hypothetical protein
MIGAGWFKWGRPQTQATVSQPAKDVYYCPMHPQVTSDRPGTCPICNMNLVKKEVQKDISSKPKAQKSQEICRLHNCHGKDGHACPMMVTAKPGDKIHCPICGHYIATEEGLVPVNESSPKDYATIEMSSQIQQLIGIRTAKVARKALSRTIHAYGFVAHDLELYEAQLEYIDAWRAYYPFISRRVVKDEFRQDWRDYYIKPLNEKRWRSDEKLKAQQRLIKAEYELLHMGINEDQLSQLRQIKYGQPWIQPDLVFFDKGQPRWIYAQVFESDLGYVTTGQQVQVTIPAYGDKTTGVVRSVAPIVAPESRTARVRIELPDYRGELSINMYVEVNIQVDLDTSLLIPREAIMDTGLRKIVFVQVEDGKFEPREIETGLEGQGMVFLLDSESRLQGAFEGMASPSTDNETPVKKGGAEHVHP